MGGYRTVPSSARWLSRSVQIRLGEACEEVGACRVVSSKRRPVIKMAFGGERGTQSLDDLGA